MAMNHARETALWCARWCLRSTEHARRVFRCVYARVDVRARDDYAREASTSAAACAQRIHLENQRSRAARKLGLHKYIYRTYI